MRGRDKFDKSSIEQEMEDVLANKYGHMDAGKPHPNLADKGWQKEREEEREEERKKFPYSSDLGVDIDNMAKSMGIVTPEQKILLEEYARRFEKPKAKQSSPIPTFESEAAKMAALAAMGNRFNQGKLQWHLVDFRALVPMVQVLMFGKNKYAEDQWKNGLSKKEILDSLHRHTFAMLSGELVDPESGELHIGHALCNLLFYSYFTTVNTEKARE